MIGESFTRRKFLKVAGSSAVALSLPFGLSRMSGAAEETLKVGGIINLTGPLAPGGKTIRKAANLAIEKLNKSGGIGGELELELVVRDGETSQTGASDAARRLANRGDISFVVGPLIGTNGMATQPILGAAGIPQIFFGTVADFTAQHDKYPLSIRYGTQTKLQMAPVLKYAVEERNQGKLFLLVPNTQRGKGFENVVRNQLSNIPGGEIVDVVYYTRFSQDFSPVLTKVLNSPAEGVVVGTGIPTDLISVIREFDRRGIDPEEFGYYTGQAPNGSVDFEKQVADKGIGNGIVYAWHYENDGFARKFERSNPPEQAIKMESAFVDKFGHPPDSPTSASWGWGSIGIISQALEGMIEDRGKESILSLDKQSELSREAVNYLTPSEGAEVGPVVDTPYGNYGFHGCGQFNIRLGVATFKDNEVYLVKDRGYGENLVGPLCS